MTRNRIGMSILIALSVGVLVFGWIRRPARVYYKVRGTIVSIDPETRMGMLCMETGPQAGEELASRIPEDCAVTIDGQGAALGDIRPGDQAKAKVCIRRDLEAGPQSDRITEVVEIKITRSEGE